MYHLLQEYKMFVDSSNDLEYWTKNFITVNGKVIKLNQMQQEINKTMLTNKIVPVVKTRQTGGTLFGCLASLHYAIFNNNVKVGVYACNYNSSSYILKEIIELYTSINDKYKPKLKYMSKDIIKFENGSEIRIITESSIKGITFNMVYIDEAAYNHNWNSMWYILAPILHYTSKVLLISSHNPKAVDYNNFIKYIARQYKLLVFPWYKTSIDANKVKTIRNLVSFESFVNEYECGGNYFIL